MRSRSETPVTSVYIRRNSDGDVHVLFTGEKLLHGDELLFELTRHQATSYRTNFRRSRLTDELVRVLFAPSTGVDSIKVFSTGVTIYGSVSKRKTRRLVNKAVRNIEHRPVRG